MKISENRNGGEMTISLEGRLDTVTAPMLDEAVRDHLDGVTDLTLDFENLEYTSSAGLRVILSAQKKMKKQGSMVIINVNDDIMEVFDLTGFSDILEIE